MPSSIKFKTMGFNTNYRDSTYLFDGYKTPNRKTRNKVFIESSVAWLVFHLTNGWNNSQLLVLNLPNNILKSCRYKICQAKGCIPTLPSLAHARTTS